MIRQNILFVLMMIPFFLLGQKKKKEQYVVRELQGIVVDGDLTEWEKVFYNTESSLWSFGIAINNGKLFAGVRVKDKALIDEAVRNGILVNISYSDKKKDGAMLVFPKANLEKLERGLSEDELSKRATNEELIRSAKGYYVKGFSKVVDGLLSFSNEYGVKAVCKIDSTGILVYEAEIPLRLIKFQTNEIAVQLGINTRFSQLKKMTKNTSSPYMGGMSGRRVSAPSAKNPYEEDTEVWFTGVIK